ncbi:MAG: hypothetical protein BWK79_09430 [Beggiatoa sp. IS2]|nr:MAG: hypothetical protein BWK79_09430 [Beggiatoa sp. IS2]
MTQEIMHPELPDGFGAFVYPPALGILAVPVGLLPTWAIAKYSLDGINILLLLITALLTLALICQHAKTSLKLDKLWFGIGIGCFMTGVTGTLHLTQTSLFAITGCLGALYFAKQQRPIIATLFIIIASTKPQLALLPLTYLFLQWGSWRLLGYAILGVSITNLAFLLQGGDSNPWRLLQDTSTTYAQLKPNLDMIWGLRGLLNLTSVLAILSFATLGLLILIGVTISYRRQPSAMGEIYKLLLPLTLTTVCMPNHHYDYVLFFPLITTLVILPWRSIGWLLPGVILIFRPDSWAALHAQIVFGHVNRPAIDGLMPIIGSTGALYLLIVMLMILSKPVRFSH